MAARRSRPVAATPSTPALPPPPAPPSGAGRRGPAAGVPPRYPEGIDSSERSAHPIGRVRVDALTAGPCYPAGREGNHAAQSPDGPPRSCRHGCRHKPGRSDRCRARDTESAGRRKPADHPRARRPAGAERLRARCAAGGEGVHRLAPPRETEGRQAGRHAVGRHHALLPARHDGPRDTASEPPNTRAHRVAGGGCSRRRHGRGRDESARQLPRGRAA